jgi:hypothetical protein
VLAVLLLLLPVRHCRRRVVRTPWWARRVEYS